jgi:hypothetical protein
VNQRRTVDHPAAASRNGHSINIIKNKLLDCILQATNQTSGGSNSVLAAEGMRQRRVVESGELESKCRGRVPVSTPK